MNITIIDTPLTLEIVGLQGIAAGKDYVGTAFGLMNRMWEIVKSSGIKNKGKNIWVYDEGDKVFAGVEIEETPPGEEKLQLRQIALSKYAYYKHIGPYSLIKQAGNRMNNEIKSMGLQTVRPYIEIYGHWQEDETKLETELIVALA